MHFEARSDLLTKLAAVPHRIEQAAAAELVPESEWQPVVVIGHLTRVDQAVWLPRLDQMASEDDPHWQWWEEPEFDWVGTYGGRSLEAALVDFTASRNEIVEHLAHLDDAGWARIGTHDTFGRIDVMGLGREILVHDAEHVAQLLRAQRT